MPSVWVRSYDFGFRHFQIRRIQSEMYQDMHQSAREPWADPYPYVYQKWHETQAWYDELPTSRPKPLARLTDLERLATLIQLLAPSHRVPVLNDLAQCLVFEYTVEYIVGLHAAIKDAFNSSSLSYSSGLRVKKIARIFVANFTSYQDRLLDGSAPQTESRNEGSPAPAPYPYPSRSNNLERTLDVIQQFVEILGYLGRRSGMFDWQREFQRDVAPILQDLLHRRTASRTSIHNGEEPLTATT